jgi:hypothetical protein
LAQIGKYIIIAGAALMALGALIYFLGDKLNWFGNLPGDIKYERENIKVYFPIVTMIILSIAISLLMWLFRRFF